MSFIGVLVEHKNTSYLKKHLEKNQLQEVIFLNEETIQNLRNIKFETLLLGKKIESKKEIFRLLAQKANYLIVNTDIKENLDILDCLDLTLITYGFNTKATITVSSTEEKKIMLCIQRNIINKYQKIIEPQELEIKTPREVNSYAVMELESLLLLYQKK